MSVCWPVPISLATVSNAVASITTAYSWETADLKRTSAFLHADYELNPDHAVRLQSMFSSINNHGRYAPAVGFFFVPGDAAEGLKQGFNYDIPYPELLPYFLGHRFVGLGNRDFKATNTLFENAVLAFGTVGMFDYEFEARHTRYDGREDSCCYAKAFTTSEYVSQGLYNPFDPLSPLNAGAYDNITSNANRDIRADFRTYSGNVSFDFLNAPGGPNRLGRRLRLHRRVVLRHLRSAERRRRPDRQRRQQRRGRTGRESGFCGVLYPGVEQPGSQRGGSLRQLRRFRRQRNQPLRLGALSAHRLAAAPCLLGRGLPRRQHE